MASRTNKKNLNASTKKRSIVVLAPQTTPIKKKAATEGRTIVPPVRIRTKDGQPISDSDTRTKTGSSVAGKGWFWVVKLVRKSGT